MIYHKVIRQRLLHGHAWIRIVFSSVQHDISRVEHEKINSYPQAAVLHSVYNTDTDEIPRQRFLGQIRYRALRLILDLTHIPILVEE